MPRTRALTLTVIAVLLLGLLSVPIVLAGTTSNTSLVSSQVPQAQVADGGITDGPQQESKTSHRLIVELESPPLAVYAHNNQMGLTSNGRLDVNSTAAQSYISRLQNEQAAFISKMQQALPQASVSTYVNETGADVQNAYQITFNGMAVDPGTKNVTEAINALQKLDGVKAVYRDYAYTTDLYTSTHLINAPTVWDSAAIGGIENAGAGVKVASMDGGVHKDAPMFDGTGYAYPAGYPKGQTSNTNGKIIASRAYFRSWDPPAPGDENPWPGENGTSHGVHTAGIAGGDVVSATYAGYDVGEMSGVAPKSYIMSYRVFYASVSNDGSFYTAEGIAALEDIVADGADVVNNSWGGGPGSAGGEFDPLDQALINASQAGVFVAMSNGNSGPNTGTGDHPSDDYINVAASTTSGTLAAGQLNVSAPTPIPENLQEIAFGTAGFGPSLPFGQVFTYSFVTAASVDPGNVEGCDPWTGTPFEDKAVLISRGSCFFSDKVRYAQQAGADFVVVYNNDGDSILNMACGDDCSDITIPSIFVGETNGNDMVDWYNDHGDDSELEMSTIAFQSGNEPDVIANFSSRGPGVGNTLKPDIAAPGVNILSQGYTPGATGEARHLGYGQASGTSMAAPHVAGAAALLRQINPGWSNAEIKSALMSTAKYTDVYNADGSPAQPLDMGAGRLDVAAATDPGVFLSPPSLSFGQMLTGTTKTISVTVTSEADTTETYDLSTLYTGDGFAITQTTALTGFAVMPAQITLDPGESEVISVTFDTAAGMGYGDNQGYILLSGDNGHDAHMPAWARVAPQPDTTADVLLIDNDFSGLLAGFPDYASYYIDALDELGISYEYYVADFMCCGNQTLPDAAILSSYDAIVYFTGDNFYPDGTFTVPTPLTAKDRDALVEYANQGGILIAMGQDATWVLDGHFLQTSVFGAHRIQDSVSNFSLPTHSVIPVDTAPNAFKGISLDLSGPDTYVGEVSMPDSPSPDEYFVMYMPLVSNSGESAGTVATLTGHASYGFDLDSNRLDYSITISTTDPVTITAAHIHEGTILETGPIINDLFAGPQYVTDTFNLEGALVIDSAHVPALLGDALYVNVHTTERPAGAIRGQIVVEPANDGANNQTFIDELDPQPNHSPDPIPEEMYPYASLLKYPGPYNTEDGVVAMAHRQQPTLENPGITYLGRSIFTSFGLEGVNDTPSSTSRAELLDTFMDWAMDEPTVAISDVTSSEYGSDTSYTVLEVDLSSNITGTEGVSYRWDFGDGSGYEGPFSSNTASHEYDACGTHTVRVEATDSWGNVAYGEKEITVVNCP